MRSTRRERRKELPADRVLAPCRGGYLRQRLIGLCGPAKPKICQDGHGEIAFGALQATLRIAYAQQSIWFDWEGCDEMDHVEGSGSAHLEHGSLEIDFAYDNGDEAVLKVVKV